MEEDSEDVIFDHDDGDSSQQSPSSESEISSSSEATRIQKRSPKQNKQEQIHTQFMYIQVDKFIIIVKPGSQDMKKQIHQIRRLHTKESHTLM